MDTGANSIEPSILECRVGENNMIYLRMGGDITMSILGVPEKFERWASDVRAAMMHVSVSNNGYVLTLIDVTEMAQFDLAIISRIRELMEFNKQYATKTAVFGATSWVSMVVRSTLALTGRTNMRIFSERDEALTWLAESESNEKIVEK